MSTAIIQCDGCKKSFTLSGHGKHLRTTTKSACIALREQIRTQLSEASGTEDLSDHDFDNPDDFDPPPTSPQSFGGDAFGAYDDDYWDQYDEYQPGLGDDEDEDNLNELYRDDFQPPASDDDDDLQDEDDEDAANLEAEYGWEPPEADLPEDAVPADENDDVPEGEPGPDRHAHRRVHQQLRTQTHVGTPVSGSTGKILLRRPPGDTSESRA